MKFVKMITRFAVAAAFVCQPFKAFADVLTAVVNGIRWTYTVEYREIFIGEDNEYADPAIPYNTQGEIVIPKSLPDRYGGYYPVTGIGAYAFDQCRDITSVIIPDSVTSIGDYAFYGCDGLQSITISDSVRVIGRYAFSGCTRLRTVKLGNGINTIENGAFENCTSLTELHLSNVTAYSRINWNGPSTLRHPWRLFQNGREISNLAIPEGTTRIGKHAFSGLQGLKSVKIPNSVTSIGDYAFSGCGGLVCMSIPDSVTHIGKGAFDGCERLFDVNSVHGAILVDGWAIDADSYLHYYEPSEIATEGYESLDLSGVRGIGDYAFKNCSALGFLTITNGVKSIGNCAFYNSGLWMANISGSVASIGDEAFAHCNNLWLISIGNNVSSIGKDAFLECRCSDTMTIPGVRLVDGWAIGWESSIDYNLDLNGARGIAGNAFYNCNKLKSVRIPDSVKGIGASAFEDCENLKAVRIGNGVEHIGDSAFCYCDNLESVIMGNFVKSIGNYAFGWDNNLQSILIPNSVTNIGYAAFFSCWNLESVAMPNSVISIGNYAFYECIKLASVTIPNSVTRIGEWAFAYNESLQSLVIPSSVTSIGQYAFKSSAISTLVLPLRFKGRTENMGIPGHCKVLFDELCPVYRFYSPRTKGHFFTMSEAEKNNLIATAAHIWNFEGIAYYAYQFQHSGTVPLYRFYSPGAKGHFYTRNEGEKNSLVATASHIWNFEGVAYYVAASQTSGTVPVYRFFSPGAKHHFYTRSEGEKNNLIATASHIWNYEGIAFYAWTSATLPRSGATRSVDEAVGGGLVPPVHTPGQANTEKPASSVSPCLGVEGDDGSDESELSSENDSATFSLMSLPDERPLPDRGLIEFDGATVEIRPIQPQEGVFASELEAGWDGDAVALRLLLPAGVFSLPLWDDEANAVVDGMAEDSFDFELPMNGSWYLINAMDSDGNEVFSRWIRAFADDMDTSGVPLTP